MEAFNSSKFKPIVGAYACVYERAPNSAAGKVWRRRQPNFGQRASLSWSPPAGKVPSAQLMGLQYILRTLYVYL